jgi:hypothetical protein
MRLQTPLGRVFAGEGQDLDIEATLTLRPSGVPPETTPLETTYLYPHRVRAEEYKYLDLVDYYVQNQEKHTVSHKYKLRDGVYVFWDTATLLDRLGTDASVKEIIRERAGWAYGFMAYSADFWNRAKPTDTDPRGRLVEPGVAIASDGMVIGDFREISLTRYIGRQQQMCCLLHLDGLRPDLGRKSFERDIEDAAQKVANRIAIYFGEGERFRHFLRASPSRPTQGVKEKDLQDWQFDSTAWAREHPLVWGDRRLALISEPQQEQDVVILFSQLVASGILPGYIIYATGETNRQYDCIVRVNLPQSEAPTFSPAAPQGLADSAFHTGQIDTKVHVLEFKYSLSELVGDFLDGEKRFKDIDIAVAWTAGARFKKGVAGEYELRTLCTEDTVAGRPYPGVTHQMVRQGTEDQVWVILLEDLFQLANDWEKGRANQIANYPD